MSLTKREVFLAWILLALLTVWIGGCTGRMTGQQISEAVKQCEAAGKTWRYTYDSWGAVKGVDCL